MRTLNTSLQEGSHHCLGSSFVSHRGVNAQRASRPSSACRLQNVHFEPLTASGDVRETAADGASTSGSAMDNIPNMFESLVHNLPSNSKRKRAVMASSTLASSIMGWRLGDRTYSSR
jgi:hypothetical protein